jgi:signal transduction histidine kinase
MQSDAYLGGRILIVDDEEANVLLLERMLSRAGYGFLTSTTDSRQAVRLFHESHADLVLLDLMMPFLDGYAVMEQILAEQPESAYVPILVLTADVTPQALRRALSAGAKDFLTKPFDQTELLLRVKNLLETRFLNVSLHDQVHRLEQLSSQAQQAVRVRDESLSEISHDLRQPLAGLKFTTESLEQEIASGAVLERPKIARDLARINSAADQLATVLYELSDLAQLQMGRELSLRRRTTDIVRLAQSVADDFKRLSRRHRVLVESTVDELVGEWDDVRLRRVLSNLLDNAMKYSPRGGEIAVSIDALTGDGMKQVRVRVKDQGIGIPEADLPCVFDRFYRAASASHEASGTGIGLSGVRQIVEQHGGSVEIESREGSGTTVTVTLPLSSP